MLLGPASSPIALFSSSDDDVAARLAEHRHAGHVTVVAHCEPLGPRRRRPLPPLRADAVLRVPAQTAESEAIRVARIQAALTTLCQDPDTGLRTRLALIEAGAGVAAHGRAQDPCDALDIALDELDVLVSRLIVVVRAPNARGADYDTRWRRMVAGLPRTARFATAWVVDPSVVESEVVLVAAGFLWSQPHDPLRMVACGGGAPFTGRRVPTPPSRLSLVT